MLQWSSTFGVEQSVDWWNTQSLSHSPLQPLPLPSSFSLPFTSSAGSRRSSLSLFLDDFATANRSKLLIDPATDWTISTSAMDEVDDQSLCGSISPSSSASLESPASPISPAPHDIKPLNATCTAAATASVLVVKATKRANARGNSSRRHLEVPSKKAKKSADSRSSSPSCRRRRRPVSSSASSSPMPPTAAAPDPSLLHNFIRQVRRVRRYANEDLRRASRRADHKRYDVRRRYRTLLRMNELKQLIQQAQKIHIVATNTIKEEPTPETLKQALAQQQIESAEQHQTSQCQLKQEIQKQKKESMDEVNEDEGEEEDDEPLESIPSVDNLESCTQLELFEVTISAIQNLLSVKSALASQLALLTSQTKDTALEDDSHLALDDFPEPDFESDLPGGGADAADVPLAKRARLQPPVVDGVMLSEADTLRHAICVVQQRYDDEVCLVNRMASCARPLTGELRGHVSDEFCIIGLDALITASVRWNGGTNSGSILSDRFVLAQRRRAVDRCRMALFAQLHSLCYLLTRRFQYQQGSISPKREEEEAGKLFWKELYEEEDSTNKDVLQQILQDSVKAAATVSTATANTKQNAQNSISSTSALTESKFFGHAIANAMCTANSSSSSDAVTLDTSKLDASGAESECGFDSSRDHPFARFALPPDSFLAMQQMLASLVAGGADQYETEIVPLLPTAYRLFPAVEPLPTALPVRLSTDTAMYSAKDVVYHPVWTPTFDQLTRIYELYWGLKPLVPVTISISSPNERAMYMDMDLFLIRHPKTNLPLAHVALPRKQYYGDPYRLVEQKALQRMGPNFEWPTTSELSEQCEPLKLSNGLVMGEIGIEKNTKNYR